jgi:hypothetical protein
MTTENNKNTDFNESIDRLEEMINRLRYLMTNSKIDWLMQRDIKPYGRIIMHIMDTYTYPISQHSIVELTGFSNKAVRENLIELSNLNLLKRSNKFNYWEKIKIDQ